MVAIDNRNPGTTFNVTTQTNAPASVAVSTSVTLGNNPAQAVPASTGSVAQPSLSGLLNELLTLLEQGAGQQTQQTQQPAQQQEMPVNASTDPQAVQNWLSQNPGQPKVALSRGGGAYLVYGTSTFANGQTMVETADPNNMNGGTAWTPIAQFDKSVTLLDPGTSGKGTQLTSVSSQGYNFTSGDVGPNQKYTFNAYYKDPQSGQPMVSLTNAQGKNVNISASEFARDFGTNGVQSVMHNAISPVARSSYVMQNAGGQTGADGYAVGQSTSPQDVGNWLNQGQYPVMANGYNGQTYIIDGMQSTSAGTYLKVEDPMSGSTGTMEVSLSEATEAFHFFDRGTGGVGTTFNATSSVAGVDAGSQYQYQGMSVDANGQAQVDLVDNNKMPVSVPLSVFAQAFGGQGLQNLMDSSRSNLALAQTAPSGTTYQQVPNAELFAASTNYNQIQQGQEGDCYLTSSMAALERQDPNALKNMIRPSTDGNPNDYDVRFYAPQKDGSYKAVWVTVNDQLPMTSSGSLAGQQAPIDAATGKPQIGYALIEKAYAQFNQQYGAGVDSQNGGYDGIAGGDPAKAMTLLTGKPQHDILVSTNSAATWQALSQANNGTPVMVGTPQGNSPDDQVSANVYNAHAYTVIGTYTDPTTHQQMVELRNPWGINTDGDGQHVPSTNGTFSIPFSQFEQQYQAVTVAGPYSSSSVS